MEQSDPLSSAKVSIPRIEALRAKKERVYEKRKILIGRFHGIELELHSLFSDMEIFASGKDVNLEQTGQDDWTYGHLCLHNGRLLVSYRSTEDDYYHSLNHLGDEQPTYTLKPIADCKNLWLEELSSEKALQSLFTSLEICLDQLSEAADRSAEAIGKILEYQAAEINDNVVASLTTSGNESLLKEWAKARASIALDPADSITRSSSYLESICKKILADLDVPVPASDTMSALIAECLKHIGLSEDQGANNALKQLFGSLKGIFQSVGAIRSNYGSAHGSSPGDYEMSEHDARLINNASASASTFLLHRLHIHMHGKKSQS